MKKIISLILIAIMILANSVIAGAVASDVKGTGFEEAVDYLSSNNIMIGDAGTGLFRPNDTIKRSEFAVVAVKAMGLNDTATISAGTTKFSDIAADNWASGYINTAANAGLIGGYSNGTYQPDRTINYAEAITILVNMLGYKESLAGKPWPAFYIEKANILGITSGVVMAPTVGASRGNTAKLVYNTLKILSSGASINPPTVTPPTTTPVTTMDSVIESKIDGDFEGWDGETIFKLQNGQIWQQDSYAYHYHYAYSPKVLIYKDGTRYKMKVDGVGNTIYVKKLK